MIVLIMSGIPGSGKTSYAEAYKADQEAKERVCVIVSADDFFKTGRNGEYIYDGSKIAAAHAQCMRFFIEAVSEEDAADVVIVDNTNTTAVEIAPYMAVANAYGADVKIVQIVASLADCMKRQTHNVPESTMLRMHQNTMMRELPPYWKIEYVNDGE
jgi:predicted kinase